MKKLIALAGSTALLLSMAGGVFATVGYPFPPAPSPDEATVLNYAWVSNDVFTKANTGFNNISGGFVKGGFIGTGDAIATGSVSNMVNSNSLGCGCYDDLFIKNKAGVNNDVFTKANTGFNSIGGGLVMGGFVHSGDAGAGSLVQNVINTNMVGD